MPMIDCPECLGVGYWNDVTGCGRRVVCSRCAGTGRVPDDFFPEDSSELRDPDEEPEEVSDDVPR